MLDPVCESGGNEALLNEGAILEGTLAVCFQKLQLLDKVGAFLIILSVSMYIGEEPPVVKVIDCILEDGICHSVTPEAMAEPGG